MKPGYACDNDAGIYFEDNEVKRVVAARDGAKVYYVSAVGGTGGREGARAGDDRVTQSSRSSVRRADRALTGEDRDAGTRRTHGSRKCQGFQVADRAARAGRAATRNWFERSESGRVPVPALVKR